MDEDSTRIDSSSDSKLTVMDRRDSAESNQNQNAPGEQHLNPISSSGADMDEESETDELTIDDSCVNDEDMMDDDNNVAIVSSSTLHQMNEDEEEPDEQDGGAVSSGYMSSEPDAVAVSSKPLHEGDEDVPMGDDSGNEKNDPEPEQSMVSTSIASTPESPPPVVEKVVRKQNAGEEDADVDIDGIEEPTPVVSATTPMSPTGSESPGCDPSQTIGSPDGASQQEKPDTAQSPSPPASPEQLQGSADPNKSDESPSTAPLTQNSQTEVIISQENFSQFDSSPATLSSVSSQSSRVQPFSQGTSGPDLNVTVDEDVMDTSLIESSQSGTQSVPNASEAENDESEQSSIANPSEKSVSNGEAPKSRSKSRSRSNTNDGDEEDVDLEDGEIMDDEEEEIKASSVSSKDKKDKDRSSKSSSSSSSKDKSSDKHRSNREKEKEKEMDKDKHRKDKKRSSKREDEKEKESSSSKKTKKRKASDAGESEQEEYLLVRGVSPGSAAAPPPAVDPWGTPVEEFGDDSKVSRAKRRRDSDGETSPHHHHHSTSRPVREPSPPAITGRRPDIRNKRQGREERKEPKSDVICAYFMQGKCQKSAIDCSFSHDAVPPRKMELCKFWMMECCAKKEKCLYLHNDFPCKYFHTGLICKAGDRCKFSHSALSEGTKQVLLKHIETAPKEILGDFPRLNRQGAINLINKMEARLRGEKVDDDDGFPEMNQNEHHGRGPMLPSSHHDRHHAHGHGRNDDRHLRGGRDHHGNHAHHTHNMNPNQRGNNDMRGPVGRGDDRHHNNNNNNNNNNRSSRWEKQQPTRGDQEKLHELMEEAGISGFYKDTLDTGVPPPGTQPPGPFPPMQAPLLPLNPVLMSQMLPGLLPHSQPNTVNNPTLANVLASLNIPSTSIAPPTTLASLPPLNPGSLNTPPNVPPSIATSQASEDSNLSSDSKTIPEHLPKMQQELFKRIQKQQQKNEKKMQNFDKSEPEEPEENWYSSEDEDESKKKESSKAEISDKISSVLNQIRQQTQPSSSPAHPPSLPLPPPVSEPSLPSFYRDTDFRNQPSSFKDIDLRNPSSIFKKIDIEPAKEINASLAHNGPFPYKVRKVAGIRKIDYSSVRMGLPPSSIVLDPRLGPKRNNSIPAPASPTESSTPDVGVQPLTIPDGTPVFDPRTMRGGGNAAGSSGSGRNAGPPGITPQQNNPFLDSDNRFVRDPRAGGAPNQPGPGSAGSQAQNIAAMAAAMAAMHQQMPNMQAPGLDPNLLMLGFPFLPQQPGGVQTPLDFQQMLAATGGPGGNLRMRPPFTSQQPPPSTWERLNQGQQGQGGGDLTPPL